MKTIFQLILTAAIATAQPRVCNETVAYTGGWWFTGSGMAARDVYVVDGVISFKKPATVDRTVDLKGASVLPPYGEAHNHNVAYITPERTKAILSKYLQEGVFYVQNPGLTPSSRTQMAGLVNVRGGLDVTFANGLLTSTGGHPLGLYKRNLERGVLKVEDGEGAFFWTIDTIADLERKWPGILAGKPDFIKAVLVSSEEYDKRKNDERYFSWRGLDPGLLPMIVHKAHSAGLRVMTHVDTAGDFHNSVRAGVDIIGHIPGFRGNESGKLPDLSVYEISDADARLASKQRTFVVTTLGGITEVYPNEGPTADIRKRADDLFRRNLRTLQRNHVHMLIGSDNFRSTSREEAMYLNGLGVFSTLELIRMWSEETPRAIFPERKIGRLREGYEASFLVLDKNPLLDFKNTMSIRARVKQGCVVDP